MKWSATSSSAHCPAMTETSARRPRRWVSAAARCIAACKNTDWNETLDVRTSHPAPRAGGGITRLANLPDSSLERLLFVADRLDAHVSHSESVAGLRSFFAASRGLLAANTFESPLCDARTGFFFSRSRRALRRRPRRSDDRSKRVERDASLATVGSARSHRLVACGDGRNRCGHFHVRQPATAAPRQSRWRTPSLASQRAPSWLYRRGAWIGRLSRRRPRAHHGIEFSRRSRPLGRAPRCFPPRWFTARSYRAQRPQSRAPR